MTERKDRKPTGVYLDKEIAPYVRTIAAMQGISISELTNNALKEYFTRHHEEIQEGLRSLASNFGSFSGPNGQPNP